MSRTLYLALATVSLLAGCASKPLVVAEAPPPPAPPPPVAVTMPAGASPNMAIPALLADGSYATPNRNLTPAATLWHMRVALNVAALACRGAEGAPIVAAYNAMLVQRRPVLAEAESHYAAEWKSGGGDWRDRYDDAMTRLYNFFSQSPARDAFCASAAQVLADGASISDAAMPAFAAERLPALERPFTDFYRAYDAWRASVSPTPRFQQPVIALNAPPAIARPVQVRVAVQPPVPVETATVVAQVTPETTRIHPRLELDPSVFQ